MIRQANIELKKEYQQLFSQLPEDSKTALKKALLTLRKDALIKANHCWKKHKAPMALYWKVVGVNAGHIARSIK
jgi:hypothetical protein